MRLLKQRLGPDTRRFAGWTAALVFTQILAGTVNVLFLAPVWMQVIHLLLADLLWIFFVRMGASALAAAGRDAEEAPAGAPVAAGPVRV
jgi:heme A synthase